jgi:hypothetical protein
MVRTPNIDRLSVALVACLAALAAALLPAAAAADPSDADLKQSLTQALAERGIEVDSISSCSPKGGGTYICRWRRQTSTGTACSTPTVTRSPPTVPSPRP